MYLSTIIVVIKHVILCIIYVCVFAGVQILHVSGNHWVCASRIAGSVEVCDSLYSQIDGDLQLQLARLYRTTDCVRDGGFVVVRKGVQRQQGTADCGVFAIAAAFHTSSGEDVTTLNFLQQQMRQHLHSVLNSRSCPPSLSKHAKWAGEDKTRMLLSSCIVLVICPSHLM